MHGHIFKCSKYDHNLLSTWLISMCFNCPYFVLHMWQLEMTYSFITCDFVTTCTLWYRNVINNQITYVLILHTYGCSTYLERCENEHLLQLQLIISLPAKVQSYIIFKEPILFLEIKHSNQPKKQCLMHSFTLNWKSNQMPRFVSKI